MTMGGVYQEAGQQGQSRYQESSAYHTLPEYYPQPDYDYQEPYDYRPLQPLNDSTPLGYQPLYDYGVLPGHQQVPSDYMVSPYYQQPYGYGTPAEQQQVPYGYGAPAEYQQVPYDYTAAVGYQQAPYGYQAAVGYQASLGYYPYMSPFLYYFPEGPKEYSKLFHVWRIAYPILTFFALQIMLAIIMGFGIVLYAASTNFLRYESATELLWVVFCILGVTDLVCIPLFILFRRMDIKYLKKLGKYTRYQRISLGKCLICLVLGIVTALIATLVFLGIGEDFAEQGEFFSTNPLLALLLVGVLTPFAEELLFRVVVYGRLRERLSPISAGLLCALTFAVAHMNPIQGITAFIYGLLMCLVYEKWKSFWAPFFIHAGINSTVVIMATLPQALSLLSTGAIPFVVMAFCLIVVVGVIFLALKWSPAKELTTDSASQVDREWAV